MKALFVDKKGFQKYFELPLLLPTTWDVIRMPSVDALFFEEDDKIFPHLCTTRVTFYFYGYKELGLAEYREQ